MADRLRVACVQLNSGTVKAGNLEKAERLVARAAATGADIVLLPEKWNAIGSADTLRANAEPLAGGESVAAMSGWARRHGITLVGEFDDVVPLRHSDTLFRAWGCGAVWWRAPQNG